MADFSRRALLTSELAEHQQRILATTAELNAVLDREAPAAADAANLRWRMLRELRGYQLFKHHHIFLPLLAAGGLVAQLAQTMKHRCEAAGQRVEAYIALWSGRDVSAAWPEHRAATAALLAAIEAHARIERREIDQLWLLHHE